MLKQLLALSLFITCSSNAMNDEIRRSRNEIMNELYTASKEDRSPSPIVIQEMEQIADIAFEYNDADLLIVGAPYLCKKTLLRMSDSYLQKIRENALAGQFNREIAVILSAMTRNLQNKAQ